MKELKLAWTREKAPTSTPAKSRIHSLSLYLTMCHEYSMLSCSSISSLVLHWFCTEATRFFSPHVVSMILLLPLWGKSRRGRRQGRRGSTGVPLCVHTTVLYPFITPLFSSTVAVVAEVQLSDKAPALHVQSSRFNTPTQTHIYVHNTHKVLHI